jgi:hypothetical protein
MRSATHAEVDRAALAATVEAEIERNLAIARDWDNGEADHWERLLADFHANPDRHIDHEMARLQRCKRDSAAAKRIKRETGCEHVTRNREGRIHARFADGRRRDVTTMLHVGAEQQPRQRESRPRERRERRHTARSTSSSDPGDGSDPHVDGDHCPACGRVLLWVEGELVCAVRSCEQWAVIA